METLSSKTVTIRKDRKCFACTRDFPVGAKMNKWVGIVQGDFSSSYSCMACVDIMNILEREDGYEEGFVHEMTRDYDAETPEQLLTTLKGK